MHHPPVSVDTMWSSFSSLPGMKPMLTKISLACSCVQPILLDGGLVDDGGVICNKGGHEVLLPLHIFHELEVHCVRGNGFNVVHTYLQSPGGVLCRTRFFGGGRELAHVPLHIHHLLRKHKLLPTRSATKLTITATFGEWLHGRERRRAHIEGHARQQTNLQVVCLS